MGELFAEDHNFFSHEAREFTGPEQFSKGMQILYAIVFKLFSGKLFAKAASPGDAPSLLMQGPGHRKISERGASWNFEEPQLQS